jgi:hypothetical protein
MAKKGLTYSALDTFRRERNAALRSLDEEKIIEYIDKYGVELPRSKESFWRCVHKAVLQIPDFTQAEYKRSYDWLKEHRSEIPEGSYYTEDGDNG